MTRLCGFLFLLLQIVVSASAAEPISGDTQDPWVQQSSVFDNLRTANVPLTASRSNPQTNEPANRVVGGEHSESPAAVREAVPRMSFREPLATLTNEKSPIQKVHYDLAQMHQMFQYDASGNQSAPASLAGGLAPSGKLDRICYMSALPRSDVQNEVKNEELQIRRVQYDVEQMHRLFQHDSDTLPPVVNLPDLLEGAYKVAAPPRSDVHDDSSSDALESVVDEIRRDVRDAMEDSDRENEAAQQVVRKDSGAVVEINDVREAEDSASADDRTVTKNSADVNDDLPIEKGAVIPRAMPESKPDAASDPLDRNLVLRDPQQDGNALQTVDDDNGSEGDAPPNPIVPGQPPERESDWHHSPWTLGLLDEQARFDPCEYHYCEQMWDCAGGRCATWVERMMRDLDRTYQVTIGRCRGCRPLIRTVCRPKHASSGKVIGWIDNSPVGRWDHEAYLSDQPNPRRQYR